MDVLSGVHNGLALDESPDDVHVTDLDLLAPVGVHIGLRIVQHIQITVELAAGSLAGRPVRAPGRVRAGPVS
jgi:hypothetical protein